MADDEGATAMPPSATGDLLSLLLLQSGDVETNPGPPRRAAAGGRGKGAPDSAASAKDDRRDSSVGMGDRLMIDKASGREQSRSLHLMRV